MARERSPGGAAGRHERRTPWGSAELPWDELFAVQTPPGHFWAILFPTSPLSRYGFVEFDDLRDADDAVYELNGKDLCGERVIVEHARGPRRDSSYGSGRSKH